MSAVSRGPKLPAACRLRRFAAFRTKCALAMVLDDMRSDGRRFGYLMPRGSPSMVGFGPRPENRWLQRRQQGGNTSIASLTRSAATSSRQCPRWPRLASGFRRPFFLLLRRRGRIGIVGDLNRPRCRFRQILLLKDPARRHLSCGGSNYARCHRRARLA